MDICLICWVRSLFDISKDGLYKRCRCDITVKEKSKKHRNIKKKIEKLFENPGLNATAITNVKVINFLYVTLDLNTGTSKEQIDTINQIIHLLIRYRLKTDSSHNEIFDEVS